MRKFYTGVSIAGGVCVGGTTDPGASRVSVDGATSVIIELHPAGVSTLNTGLQLSASSTSGFLWLWDNKPLIFATNNSERMRIGASGGLNIGGTTDPGAGNLFVANSLVLGNGATGQGLFTLNGENASGGGGYIAFQKGGTAKWWVGATSRIMGGTSDSFSIYNAGTGLEVIRIGNGVNIGGTSEPGVGNLWITGDFQLTNGIISGLSNLVIQPYSGNSTSGVITSMTIAPSNGVNGSTAQTVGAASAIMFGGVFTNYSPDQATRYSARIRSGFATGIWGTEYLAFDVGTNGTGAAGSYIERARFTGSGGLNIGGTNDVAAGSIYLKGSPEPLLTFYTTDSGYNGEAARFVAGSNGSSWNQGVLVLQGHTANSSAWGNIQKWFASGGVIIGAGNTDPGAYSLVVEGQVRLNKQNQNALAYMNNAGAQAFAILRSLNSNDANDIQFYDVTNSIIRMTIGATGGVSIGSTNTDPGAGKLIISGASSALRLSSYGAGTLVTDASGNVTVSSDETLKIIESDFERGMADLRDLKPKKGHWSAESGLDTTEEYVWLTAQDLLLHIPEAVFLGSDDKHTVDQGPVLHAVINALNELDARLARLEGASAPKPDKTDRKKLAVDRVTGLKQRQIERNHRKG